jgi:hypothetical protein
MSDASRIAVQKHRSRLKARGVARFEVQGLDRDRELIRRLARRLAEEGPEAQNLRREVERSIGGEPPKTGGILAALRRSPLVGVDLALERPFEAGREVDL